MKSKTILSAEETLEILNSQWATVQDIMKIGLWEEIKQEILKIKYQMKLYQVDLNYLIT